MPTYQYRCTSCERELEVVQKFTDPALTTCDACQGRLRKVFNAVGVVFKGSGFYSTDSGRKGKAAGQTPAADAGKGTETKATEPKGSQSTSSESKPSEPKPAPAAASTGAITPS